MTKDDQPQTVSPELFKCMSNMPVHLSMNGHQLGGLCFVLETAEASGQEVLAGTKATPDQRKQVETLQQIITDLLAGVRQDLTYLSIAATAQLAAEQDNAQNAPSTDRAQ